MNRRRGSWPDWADGLLDLTVLAFAAWTLLYEVAMFADLPTEPVVVLWLVGAAASAWLVLRWLRRPEDPGPPDEPGTAVPDPRVPRTTWLVAGALLVVAVVLALADSMRFFWPMWAAAVAANLLLLWQAGRQRAAVLRPILGTPAHLGALLVSLGLAVLSSFMVRTDGDDVYYVNRSTWVAEHETFSMRDTMFGAETYASTYGGGAPIASVEALFGVVGDLLGIHAATVTYLVAVPVGSLLTGWAFWRLVRSWGSRRHLLVFLAAVAFLLMSSASVIGDFSLPRMWQGKVPATTVLVPLIWVYLTQWAERGSRRSLTLLAAAGISLVGLTSTAVILAPVIAAAAVLAGLLQRRVGPALTAAVTLSAFPVLMGAVVVLLPAAVGGEAPTAQSPAEVFHRVLGEQPVMVALALVGLVLAPVLARRGPAGGLAGASALASLAVLAPGVMVVLNAATGSGPILWRLMLVAPVSVLVGLLLSARLGGSTATDGAAVDGAAADGGAGRRRELVTAGTLTAVLAALVLGAGTPVWESPRSGKSRLVSSPAWKVHARTLAEVREALELEHGDGPVLLPPAHMQVMAISTAESFPVSPRRLYTAAFPEQRGAHVDDRLFLSMFANGKRPDADPAKVDEALERLDVTMVCLLDGRNSAIVRARRAGYDRVDDLGRLVCLRPSEPVS